MVGIRAAAVVGQHEHSCLDLGLVISPIKTEIVVIDGPGAGSTCRVGNQVLLQSASFNCLGLMSHASGSKSSALQRLAHNVVGACAQLLAELQRALVSQSKKSFPLMRRLFNALVLLYRSEIKGSFCSPVVMPRIKKMANVQLAFFRQLCRLKRSVTPPIIFG